MVKMRDLTRKNLLWNTAPQNPVQTAFRRFQKTPHGPIRSAFTDSQELFTTSNPLQRREVATMFSDILGPLILGEEEESD